MPITAPVAPGPSTTDAAISSMIPQGADWVHYNSINYAPLPEDVSTVGVDMSDHQMTPYGVIYAVAQVISQIQAKAHAQGKQLYGMDIYGSPTQIVSDQGRGGYRFIVVTEK